MTAGATTHAVLGDPGALVSLLRRLDAARYGFITPGGSVIGANRKRRRTEPRNLRDIFGWSLPFTVADLDPDLFALCERAGVLEPCEGGWRSLVRVSTVEGRLFVHSAYPPRAADAVFLGPDTYRFASMILAHAAPGARSVLDIGCGSGVGAILAAARLPAARVVATDINPAALALASISAQANRVSVEFRLADGAPPPGESFDLIVANPPFISGSGGRTYRDGGGMRGLEAPLAWAQAGAQRLNRGGRMLIYTGVPIEDGGQDPFRTALEQQMPTLGRRLDYREIDPDIFGGLLGREDYEGVERIAAVAAIITRPEA